MPAETPVGAGRGDAAVICVNYGSTRLLEANLAPLTRATGIRAVVVDNYSTAAERTALIEVAGREGWRLVPMADNRGFGAGVNAGVLAAVADGARRFVVLNPDARIEATGLDVLLRTADQPGVVAAPVVVRPDGSVWSSGSDLYWADGRIRATRRRPAALHETDVLPWLSGACLALARPAWEAVGGFSDDYFLYWEDVDFCYRATRAGLTLELVPDARVVHAEGGTQQAGLARAGQAKSPTYYQYNIRNRLLFGARFLDGRRWRSWLWNTPAVSWEILLQGGRRQFLQRPGVLVAALRGLTGGLALAVSERIARRRSRGQGDPSGRGGQ